MSFSNKNNIIRIGTRASQLALWQANYIARLLTTQGAKTEIITISTMGDKILDRALSKIGSKGVFTQEIETQLSKRIIDIAVHSAKDLQATLPEGFQIIAFTQREKVNDVLVSFRKDIFCYKQPFTIGTSSTRRVAMLKRFFPDHTRLVDMRGNLQTRMQKMRRGDCDALVLAYAGVQRMKVQKHIISYLSLRDFIPAAGQGSVAVEIYKDMPPEDMEFIRKAINHNKTMYCLLAERAYLKELGGGCSTPVFALANIKENQLLLTAGIISLDGKKYVKEQAKGNKEQAEEIGRQLAVVVLQKGGKEILEEIFNR